MIKHLKLVMIMLLSAYPIVELTRVIRVSGQFYFPEMDGQFIAEIVIMWILYLSIPLIYYIKIKNK